MTYRQASMDADRWEAMMRTFGFGPNAETFAALGAAYSEAHRHYHTAAHVAACLQSLDACAALAHSAPEIELALWFHDAIYRPLSKDNEARSADWTERFLAANGAPAAVVDRVRQLILATAHAAPAQTPDESLLLDIDLAILGADTDAYDAYEAAIRNEYRMVPMMLYRKKRVEVLQGFLLRPGIYLNAVFREQREQRARANLARAISGLSA